MLIYKRILINLFLLQTWKIRYELHKDQIFLQNKFEIELLQNNNPLIIFSPNHPSSEDELKWIEMSYHQGLAKEDVMSQSLNRMHGGQGKFLHMRIMDFRINKVPAQIKYDMLMELLIFLNQNKKLLFSPILLQRKLPMAWGTTIDKVTVEINPFPYARETKHLTLKDLETYLILDGCRRSPLMFFQSCLH